MLLQLQPAVGARAIDQRRRGPARGARQLVGRGALADGDRRQALALELGAPLAAQEVAEPTEIVLLDQEVRLGPSAFSRAGRATDDRGDARGEAAIPERLHVRDRSRHRGHQRLTVEQVLRRGGGEWLHASQPTQFSTVGVPGKKISGSPDTSSIDVGG